MTLHSCLELADVNFGTPYTILHTFVYGSVIIIIWFIDKYPSGQLNFSNNNEKWS